MPASPDPVPAQLPAQFQAQLTGDLHTLLTAAAFALIADKSLLQITGPDAPRWLNGMVTNNIQALNPGEGNYNFLLNAQGRIQGDCTIYRTPDPSPEQGTPAYILATDPTQLGPLHQLLDRFIIMDDVELTALPTYTHGLHLLGPQAPAILGTMRLLFEGTLPDLLANATPLRLGFLPRSPVVVTTPAPTLVDGALVPRFYLASSEPLDFLLPDLHRAGAVEATPATLEALRILAAQPRYAIDIRNTDTAKDLPQETNQPHALHFAKGCYLGQEIVERIRSRGQVHRLFTPFRLDGPAPTTLPTPLTANNKPAGELTSATTLETTTGPLTLALGYARREALTTHAPLTYNQGAAWARSAGSIAREMI